MNNRVNRIADDVSKGFIKDTERQQKFYQALILAGCPKWRLPYVYDQIRDAIVSGGDWEVVDVSGVKVMYSEQTGALSVTAKVDIMTATTDKPVRKRFRLVYSPKKKTYKSQIK